MLAYSSTKVNRKEVFHREGGGRRRTRDARGVPVSPRTQGRRTAPDCYALRAGSLYPALTRWATYCRAYGAQRQNSKGAAAKAAVVCAGFFGRLQSRPPPHECGGSHGGRRISALATWSNARRGCTSGSRRKPTAAILQTGAWGAPAGRFVELGDWSRRGLRVRCRCGPRSYATACGSKVRASRGDLLPGTSVPGYRL